MLFNLLQPCNSLYTKTIRALSYLFVIECRKFSIKIFYKNFKILHRSPLTPFISATRILFEFSPSNDWLLGRFFYQKNLDTMESRISSLLREIIHPSSAHRSSTCLRFNKLLKMQFREPSRRVTPRRRDGEDRAGLWEAKACFFWNANEKGAGRAKRSNMVALRACTMAMLHGQSEKRDTRTIYHVPHGPCRTFSSLLLFLPSADFISRFKGSYRASRARKLYAKYFKSGTKY